MKKKVVLGLIAVILSATTAVAMGEFSSVENIGESEMFVPSYDRIADYIGYDTEEKFDKMHKTAVFMEKYCNNKESFSYIENLILSGCDVQTVMDIYQFYLTTNEDIAIVKQIYDMVYNGEPITNRDVVFENAFNEITDNKCGVLTEDDVIMYMEKGLTIEDISRANLLCRKGVMTIQEILNELLKGTSWEEIIETISGESISNVYANADEETLVNAIYVANVQNDSIDNVLGNDNNDYFKEKTKNANEKLKSKGYWKGKKSENFEKITKEANKKGISKEKIEELMDKGYSELDIVNAISEPTCTPKTIDGFVRNEVAE